MYECRCGCVFCEPDYRTYKIKHSSDYGFEEDFTEAVYPKCGRDDCFEEIPDEDEEDE